MSDTQRMLATTKQVLRWPGLKARSNHAGHLIGVAELIDDQGITLPGYTLQLEVKAPIDSTRCLFLFSIMRLHQKKRQRVYQLEVAPKNKRTHNGATTIYGPHVHLDDAEPTPVTDSSVDCGDWSGSLLWFFTHAGVQPFEIQDPNSHVEL